MRLGQTTITYLPDGSVRGVPEEFFPGSTWRDHAHLLDSSGCFTANVGSFLVRSPGQVVLVDLGSGTGPLLTGLAAEGLSPGDVDAVVFTHLHRDHVGWAGAFPRARYLVAKAEWEYWRDRPGGVGPSVEALQAVNGFFDELPIGFTAVAAPGHTPGHTCLLVSDPGATRRLLILGDLLHTRAQFAEPGWRFRSDVDPALAVRSRAEVLARFDDGRTTLAAGHFAGNVFGA